jgi:hypothetical protein
MRAWEGIELEGRLRGVRTLYLGEGGESVPDEVLRRYAHVWVNAECHGHSESILAGLSRRADQLGVMLTIEVDADLADKDALTESGARGHVVATLEGPGDGRLDTLSGDDEIRVIDGPLVLVAPRSAFTSTTYPDDYSGDREVSW